MNSHIRPASQKNQRGFELPSLLKRAGQLRIAIVSDAIANRNGVGTYYRDLVGHLANRVHNIVLHSPSLEPDRDFERFSLPMPGDRTQRLVWPMRRRLFDALDRQQPSVIIIPTLGACAYFGLRYARRNRIPSVYVHHTDLDKLLHLYWPSLIASPMQWMLYRMNRWLINRADSVAALSSQAYEDLAGSVCKPVRVMGTPVGIDFLSRPTIDRGERIRRVIFMGRLATEKGVTEVLKAAQQLPELQFAIAGDGPQRALVEQSAAERSNVSYLGWLRREQVLDELDRSDVLVLPSKIEAFGTVALETLSRSRLVLCRPECGIAKWPALARGLFFLHENESVSVALQRMIAMPAVTRREIAARGWQAVQDFNQNTTRLWLSYLADVAANGAPGAKRGGHPLSKTTVSTDATQNQLA